ncbi:cytokine receptor common subunit gamma-like [Chiloscyllium plagiosum]|uniref:cytokine receptor common subunit gamma-like n=1 Tax=Chiloscyllium plagiosum TaxID=36176 RepID=UPI001CB81B58|nr:cytokine receptor common subunit gamma-like [Chiloscyllium plagiosum]
MALMFPLCVAFLVSLQQMGAQSTKKGESLIAKQVNCIYHNMEYVNCTWKLKEGTAPDVNNTFYYGFAKSNFHRKFCSLNKENQSCGLKKRKKAQKWLWLYITTLNNSMLLAVDSFRLQNHGPHRLINKETNTSNLNCTYYDDGNLSCMWIQDKDTMYTSEYEVNYMFSETPLHMKQCSRYLQINRFNGGCLLFEDSNIFTSNWLYVYITDVNNYTIVKPYTFMLVEEVKLNPPQNLSAKLIGKEEILLTWDLPKSQKREWLQYAIKYKSNMDSKWKVEEFKRQSFTLASVDPTKYYTLYLRSRLNHMYAQKCYWSEWGPMLIWEQKTAADSPRFHSFILVLILAALLAMLVAGCVVYKIKRINTHMLPGIPDPKHLFVELFEDYNGNFQEWIGVSKYLIVDSQSECIPMECQIEEESVRLKLEQEDSQQLPLDKPGRPDSVSESINEKKEKSVNDAANSQLLVPENAMIDMSKVIMDENMYVRL